MYFCPQKIIVMDTVSTPLFIGREYEKSLIQQYLDSPKAELVAIYGRRRVGKTYLVKSFFQNQFDFYFTGMYETSRAVHLSLFRKELSRLTTEKMPPLRDWFTAFDALKDYLKTLNKEKMVVFLDELPWMDTPRSNFLAAFSNFWNTWGSTQRNLKLFVCGSATTWMLDKFVGDKGGLYGRVCRPIHLSPFSLDETEQYFLKIKGLNWGRMQILETYMIMGGIPYYLDMMETNLPLSRNIDRLFFGKDAPLRNEYTFLFRSLFKESKLYQNIVETLSTKLKGLTRKEIMSEIGIGDGGVLTLALENLCKCDFIRKYTEFGKKGKNTLYQLTDLFSLFHLRFVDKGSGQDELFWTNIQGTGVKNAWSGYAFEQVCLLHLNQIKSSMSILGILSNAYTWLCKPFTDSDGTHWKGGQIDLLIDRNDNVISVCEMKYAQDNFTVDASYAEHLRNRETLFRKETKTKKALQHVLVTTFGLHQNVHSGIFHHVVTLDHLFLQPTLI